MMLAAGKRAPAFTLLDQHGKKHSLRAYQGRWVLVYFYPKDDTSGCTKEACAIRDEFPAFKKLSATVLGISVDSVQSHSAFADTYALPFTLLADSKREVVAKYGVWQKKHMYGRTYMGTLRASFLIDPSGVIRKVYPRVKPETHAEEVLEDLRMFKKK